LIFSLLVLGVIACGAVYVALHAGPVVVKRSVSESPSRPLAYEQKVNRSDAPGTAEQGPQKHAMAPSEAPAQPSISQSAPAPDAQATATEQGEAEDSPGADNAGDAAPQTATLPPEEGPDGAGATDPNALPWQHAARPDQQMTPDEGPDGPGPMEAQPGEDDYPSEDMAARPGENDDPNAWPAEPQGGEPQDEKQEWVQVLVSGAGMQSAASDDAPALFAFPYGRQLKVVSRYGNWVEVTDPQSSATGWMKAQYLAPVAAPKQPGDSEAMYDGDDEYNDEPRRRGGWFRRNGGGFADMINRALGGH
jgi:hypothetical protein